MTLDVLEPRPIALAHTLGGMAEAADFFWRTSTLTASNFASPMFSAIKDSIPFQRVSKVQEAESILRMGFALSK